MADDEDYNENCFWMDGKIFCLKAARIGNRADVQHDAFIMKNEFRPRFGTFQKRGNLL